MPEVSYVWAVHSNKHQTHDDQDNRSWRGVLVGHFNDIDFLKAKTTNPKPIADFLGYVYDPNLNYKDIVLNEIEGRLLECVIIWNNDKNIQGGQQVKLPAWQSIEGKPRTNGTRFHVMIDDVARKGGVPDYKNNLAFQVGFATWDVKSDPKARTSTMAMRPVWRDALTKWGRWTDPSGHECTLYTMYFITNEKGIPNVTQPRPDYKFKPVETPIPTPGTNVHAKRARMARDEVMPATGESLPQTGQPDGVEDQDESFEELEKEMDAPADGEAENPPDEIETTDDSGAKLEI